MGSFTSTTPDTAGAKAPAASSHADQIQGAAPAAPVTAPAAFPAPSPMPGISDYSHADQIMGANIMPDDPSDFRIDPLDFPDPSNSPWLNPPRTGANVLDPFGGASGTGGAGGPATTSASGARNLPVPPPMPPKPAPAPTPASGLAGRVSGNHGQTPIYRPNELEGGGNTKESAAYVQKKNADAAKIAKTEARVEARHAEERAKIARERQETAEKVQRWHANEIADAQEAQIAQRRQLAQTLAQPLAKTVATKVRQLMEPAGHPGLSDDAKVVLEARRQPLSAEAAASNDRQVKALRKIGGVGDLPTYTADAAENYGDKGIDEVADLIHRTAATDPAKGRKLLDDTTARMSADKAKRLKQTVASYKLDEEPGASTEPSGDIKTKGTTAGVEPKEPQAEKEIEWNDKPSEQVYDGRNEFNVDGPIKIDPSSVTFGLDGLKYEVDWYTLDKNGNVVPEWRSNDFKPKEGTASSIYGYSGKSETYHPPIPSKHGYRVIIRVPPQHSYNGNSTGVHLNVYSPKGTRMNKISK